MIVVIIVAVAAWLFSGSKNEEQIDFKQETVTTQTLQKGRKVANHQRKCRSYDQHHIHEQKRLGQSDENQLQSGWWNRCQYSSL